MQLRAAINEDVSIIATKDGFIVSDTPVIPNDGWADIAAGLKINVYKDVCSQSLISVGTTYEAPLGSPRSLQGNGDGEFHMFTSGATKLFGSTTNEVRVLEIDDYPMRANFARCNA